MLNIHKTLSDIEGDIYAFYHEGRDIKRVSHAIVCRAIGILNEVSAFDEQSHCARALAEILKIEVKL